MFLWVVAWPMFLVHQYGAFFMLLVARARVTRLAYSLELAAAVKGDARAGAGPSMRGRKSGAEASRAFGAGEAGPASGARGPGHASHASGNGGGAAGGGTHRLDHSGPLIDLIGHVPSHNGSDGGGLSSHSGATYVSPRAFHRDDSDKRQLPPAPSGQRGSGFITGGPVTFGGPSASGAGSHQPAGDYGADSEDMSRWAGSAWKVDELSHRGSHRGSHAGTNKRTSGGQNEFPNGRQNDLFILAEAGLLPPLAPRNSDHGVAPAMAVAREMSEVPSLGLAAPSSRRRQSKRCGAGGASRSCACGDANDVPAGMPTHLSFEHPSD